MYRCRDRLERGVLAGLMGLMLLALVSGEAARAGWSVDAETPKRVVLKYEADDDKTKLLMLACMRDVNIFGVFSSGLVDQSAKYPIPLSMVNGHAHYSVRGEMALDADTNAPTVSYQTDIDSKSLQLIRANLLPVLQGRGPIVISVNKVSKQLPLAGLAEPLRKFNSVCFGGQ